MNQKEHIEKTINELKLYIEKLYVKHNIPKYISIERCLSNTNIKELSLNDELSIYDKLDSIYKKSLKSFFYELKSINFLGNPKLFYYKDNTIKISSILLETLWFDGSIHNISFIMDKYLGNLKEFLGKLQFIKYVQYILDIPGLKLEIGEEKITIEDTGIIITFPFNSEDVNYLVSLIRPALENKNMEIMSSILLLKKSNNEIYIPQKYEDYKLPQIFNNCLNNFYIKSINQSKYVKVFYKGKFVEISYLSAYEFMNNKINKPFCYFYIENNRLLDEESQNKINRILKLQDNLE